LPSSRQYEYFDDDPSFPSTLVISTLFVGAFIGFLNETLLNVALPTLMREFSVEKTTVQWMVTGFMLVMGALAPSTSWIMAATTASRASTISRCAHGAAELCRIPENVDLIYSSIKTSC